jgi:beta-lactamase class C
MRGALALSVVTLMVLPAAASGSQGDRAIRRIVSHAAQPMLSEDDAGGVAVAVRIEGRTLFFNFGLADRARQRPITPDSLFNLASVRKVFEADLLARAVLEGELALDDPVAKYVTELADGGDITRVTIGQLATHTSGLLLPQDHPPWPTQRYTLGEFLALLKAWKEDKEQAPGKQHIYTHAGYILLQLAYERRFGKPIAALIKERVLAPLGLASTFVPTGKPDGPVDMPADALARAVQGYGDDDEPIGAPGDQQSYYDFPGTGQMYSSARDLAAYAAGHLGELPIDPAVQEAMGFAERPLFPMSPRNAQALAWEINTNYQPTIVEKNGGMNNSSTYVGMMPDAKLAVVILSNRGNQDAARVGRAVLSRLLQHLKASHAAAARRRN